MASSPTSPDPLLVSIKAVDPALYPFYGAVDLAPACTLTAALTPTTVAVGDDLLMRLNLHVGDPLKLGNQTFRIVATVVNEPDRLSGSFTVGPRVLISRAALESTGLLAPGNRANERVLFKLPRAASGQPVSDTAVASLKSQLTTALPDAQITDYREPSPAITNGLDAATSLLSLMSLVALVLGAVGVAMAMRAHLQQRLDTIAIMKSLGARSSQIIKIYLLQTLFLGVARRPHRSRRRRRRPARLPLLPRQTHQRPARVPLPTRRRLHRPRRRRPHHPPLHPPAAAGHSQRPPHPHPPPRRRRFRRPLHPRGPQDQSHNNIAQIVATALILAGLAAIAMTLSDSYQVGKWFSIGLVLVLLVLLGASAAVLAALKFFLNRTRLHLPSSLRHGLANLYRPGNPSAALLAALGLGVMQIMTVYLVQKDAVKEMNISAAPNLPNVFLIDIADSEIAGVKALLHTQPVRHRRTRTPPHHHRAHRRRRWRLRRRPQAQELPPPRPALRQPHLERRPARPAPASSTGQWWQPTETKPQVAISQRMATRLGVHVGSSITFVAQDKPIPATVAAIIRSNGQHTYSRAEFTLNHAALQGLPVVWYGGVHVVPNQVAQFERALNRSYPTITIINVAAVVESVRSVVIQIIYVVQFLAAFSIFAGIIILASSIAGTKYRRIREVVVLKTLGATRARIATIFSIEFAVLGLVAGTVGICFANFIAWALEKFTPMNLTFKARYPSTSPRSWPQPRSPSSPAGSPATASSARNPSKSSAKNSRERLAEELHPLSF